MRNLRESRTGRAAAAVGAGIAGAFFLDPQSGKRRRHVARDRIAGLFRRGGREASRQAEYRGGQAAGVVKGAVSKLRPPAPAASDEALADRVRSQVFRSADAPKSSVNLNVVEGIVYLRGEVKRPEDMEKLVDAAREVDGVKDVESLLHLPKT